MSVSSLLAKAMGQLLWMRVAPSPYSLVSVCTMKGFDLSQHARVALREGLTDPGFEVLECCICTGIPIPIGKLIS